MPREYFDNLNKINEEDENPRVLEYAKEYINRKEGEITQGEVINFLNNKKTIFTIAESVSYTHLGQELLQVYH